jgi:hypothetical protein
MTTEVLGSYSFTSSPTINGDPLIVSTSGTVPIIAAGITSSRPTAGIVGRIYIDTTTLNIGRDNGASWDTLGGGGSGSITATANETSVAGSTIGLANDAIFPGTGGVTFPIGTTAERPVAPNNGQTRWSSTLGYAEQYNGAVWQPLGKVIQNVTGPVPQSSGTITAGIRWTLGATAPTTAQGFQLWTQSVTPVSAASKFIIRCTLSASYSTTNTPIFLAIFSGTTCIGMTLLSASSVANQSVNIAINISQPSVSTAAITFSARLGVTAGTGVLYWNQGATALPATMVTEYEIEEVL